MSLTLSRGGVCPRFDHVAEFECLPDTALLDVQTIAVLACRSRASIWRDVNTGRLPKPIAIGPQTRRWRVSDVRAYLNGGGSV